MAGREEAGDLPAAVGQELEEPQHAADHLIDAVRLVAFGEQGLARRLVLERADGHQMAGPLGAEADRQGEVRRGRF